MNRLCALISYKFNLPFTTFQKWSQSWSGTELEMIDLLEKEDIFNLSFRKSDFSLKRIEESGLWLEQRGIDVIHSLHEDYPALLREIHKPPLILFTRGNLELLRRKKISIVGSREILPWVSQWMRAELPVFHQNCPEVVTVSGGARGVDLYAHRAAAAEGGGTIVVLPSGVLNPYPKTIAPLLGRYDSKKILWVSEYWPDQGMRKFHFHKRNRIITGLSSELFVAQAGQRSGSMITARLALENNRSIQCLPMTPFDLQGSGNLKLLSEGAGLVRHAWDLIGIESVLKI